MVELGYKLSSEEFGPLELVQHAERAEDVGFEFAIISDHYHPWTDRQGQSPFVWSVLGGIACATSRLKVGTGVTCPIRRLHPAIVAQAAATAAAMVPGRFFLGLGTGENLNEHILGDAWPPADVRQAMLEEAVEIIRLLWQGETTDHYGDYFVVENAHVRRRYVSDPENASRYRRTGGASVAAMMNKVGGFPRGETRVLGPYIWIERIFLLVTVVFFAYPITAFLLTLTGFPLLTGHWFPRFGANPSACFF